MKICARNILKGSVDRVNRGAVNAAEMLALLGGESVTAIITNGCVEALGITAGKTAIAIMKASQVLIGKEIGQGAISARNVLSGAVTTVHDSAVICEVMVRLAGGSEVAASITKESVKSLGLQPGEPVSAIVKASNAMLGVE